MQGYRILDPAAGRSDRPSDKGGRIHRRFTCRRRSPSHQALVQATPCDFGTRVRSPAVRPRDGGRTTSPSQPQPPCAMGHRPVGRRAPSRLRRGDPLQIGDQPSAPLRLCVSFWSPPKQTGQTQRGQKQRGNAKAQRRRGSKGGPERSDEITATPQQMLGRLPLEGLTSSQSCEPENAIALRLDAIGSRGLRCAPSMGPKDTTCER